MIGMGERYGEKARKVELPWIGTDKIIWKVKPGKSEGQSVALRPHDRFCEAMREE